jgi:3-oxoacyl-[acyl-carrier protein] reductase
LGQALTREFERSGWRVIAARRRGSNPEPGSCGAVWHVSLDVSDAGRVEEVFTEVECRFGRLDALVNNAGVARDRLLPRMEEEAWSTIIDVNLKGAARCARAALGLMLPARSGHIVNVSSFSALRGNIGQANYAAAKAGLIGFSQSLAREVGPFNIQVNTVLPGVLATGMTAGMDPERRNELVASNVLNRIGDADEIGRFIAFLCTLKNVSGQVFQLDSRIAPWT